MTTGSIHPEGQKSTPLKKKKWCLLYVSPPGLDDDFISHPLGIISVGAVLAQHGVEVRCRDERVHSEEEVVEAMEWADVVGFSAMTPFAVRAIRWAGVVAAMAGDRIAMMGGAHAMVDPELFLESGLFHYVFSGEAEESLVEVLDADGDPGALREILGISFVDTEGRHVVNEKRPLIQDLDTVPWPDHELLPLQPYFERNPERLFYVFSSRGCPFSCVFCDKSLTGRTFRARSAENVADELERLQRHYSPGNILFIDELFTCEKKRVMEVCDEIIRRGIAVSWACETRVDLVDVEMTRKMYDAGMRRMYFGAESGSDRVLTTLEKRFTRQQVIDTLRMMRKENIWTKMFLIIGTPGETGEDHEDTRTMLRVAHPDAVRTSLFNPLPSTRAFQRWYDQIDKRKILTTFVDADDSPLIHENFSVAELNAIRDRIRSEHERWYVEPRQRLVRRYWRWRFYLLNPRYGWRKVVEKIRSPLRRDQPRATRTKMPAGHAQHLAGRWADVQEGFRGEPTAEALARWERILHQSSIPECGASRARKPAEKSVAATAAEEAESSEGNEPTS